ncbi:MAG: polyprenyl synthetase family protein [Deltaproteobacteria bacterium]|nr:polyprenyl synthetase family protein [Deltaproteobacteria bacterium]
MPFDLESRLAAWKAGVEAYLDARLPPPETFPRPLYQSMRYSLFAGGKRIRPAFAFAAAEAVGGKPERVLPFAAALEMVHTYSLIHDDLPAMDDDELRRGKPTNHVLFGDGIAILAGDALLTDAFAVLASDEVAASTSPELIVKVVGELARGAGTGGMVAGQALDLTSEGKDVDLSTLEYLHTHKTGALIRAAVRIGALAGGADSASLEALTAYAEELGLAFQIADDVLDVIGSTEALGKPVGSDEGLEKATYPALLGIDESKRRAAALMQSAIARLQPFGERAECLAALARFVVERQH